MLTIPLSQGFVATVDDEDGYLAQFKWSASVRKRKSGALTVYAIREDYATHRHVMMHRLILGDVPGDIDHRDGNGLNNCRYNLRLATRSENSANARKRLGSSQYKGVHFSRNTKKWCAQILKRHIGVFREECDAATAYNFAAAEEFGEFARFNSPN